MVLTTKDDLQRYGRVTNQVFYLFSYFPLCFKYIANIIMYIYKLRKSAQELKNCAENYQKLYQSAFDADPGSLINIRAYPLSKYDQFPIYIFCVCFLDSL